MGCMPKVDEGITPHHADEVEEHDGREEVLCLELDGEEHDAELSSRVLHAESSRMPKSAPLAPPPRMKISGIIRLFFAKTVDQCCAKPDSTPAERKKERVW